MNRGHSSWAPKAMLCAIAIFTATSYVSSTSAYASVEDGARNCASGQKTLNTQKIDLKVMTHDIKGTLELIGQASGIPIVISRKLKGRMKGLELQGTLREALTTLAENNNAIWWWSGNGVRIVPRNTTVTRSIRFPSFEDLIETAKTLCLPVDAITYHSSYDAQYARVSGPAEVVSEIEKLAKSLRNSYANVTQLRYGRVVRKDLSAK